MKQIGLGIVGSGRMGRLRAHLASGSPEVKFLALSDRDPARAKLIAEETQADFHTGDNEAVLAHPDVDAVIVSTPEFDHADAVCRALELGKPVLCEKPISLSLEDADRILAAYEQSSAELFIGYTQRQRRRFLNAKEQIQRGRLGHLQTARATLYNVTTNGAEIYKRAAHAGPVTDTLTYMVDICLWYFEGSGPKRVLRPGGQQGVPASPDGLRRLGVGDPHLRGRRHRELRLLVDTARQLAGEHHLHRPRSHGHRGGHRHRRFAQERRHGDEQGRALAVCGRHDVRTSCSSNP